MADMCLCALNTDSSINISDSMLNEDIIEGKPSLSFFLANEK